MGTMMHIKPVLHVDDEGRLIPIGKVMSRKLALKELVNIMKVNMEGYDNPIVMIGHGDCIDDANFVAEKITQMCGITNIVINDIGPVIGSHSGPGTIALFYLGKNRAKM